MGLNVLISLGLGNNLDGNDREDFFSHRLAFEGKLADKMIDISYSTFSVLDVSTAVNSMKCPGPDGLNMEAFHYSGKRLCILLCILFNMCMKYGYVPGPVRSAVMVPLLKCKTGDISDVDNYRAITLSPILNLKFWNHYCWTLS